MANTYKIKITDLLNDKGVTLIKDAYHIIGLTKVDNLRQDTIKENYGGISFGMDVLDRVRNIVNLMHGERAAETDIKVLVPKENGLLVFIARHPTHSEVAAHADSPEDLVIIVAPRLEEGSLARPDIHSFTGDR